MLFGAPLSIVVYDIFLTYFSNREHGRDLLTVPVAANLSGVASLFKLRQRNTCDVINDILTSNVYIT